MCELTAIEVLEKYTKEGNAYAMAILGWLECDANKPKRPVRDLLDYFVLDTSKRQHENEEYPVMEELKECKKLGKFVLDIQKGYKLIEESFNKGNRIAYDRMALCCELGIITEMNLIKAIELFQSAIEMGNANAMHNLAWCYDVGHGVEKNDIAAFQLYKKAAKLGNSNAVYSVGYCYKNGIGTPVDGEKAIEFYKKAVDMGNVQAMNNLGVCYEEGYYCLERDNKKAVELYIRAAKQGNCQSMNNLALCYRFGRGVEPEITKSLKLLKKSPTASKFSKLECKTIISIKRQLKADEIITNQSYLSHKYSVIHFDEIELEKAIQIADKKETPLREMIKRYMDGKRGGSQNYNVAFNWIQRLIEFNPESKFAHKQLARISSHQLTFINKNIESSWIYRFPQHLMDDTIDFLIKGI